MSSHEEPITIQYKTKQKNTELGEREIIKCVGIGNRIIPSPAITTTHSETDYLLQLYSIQSTTNYN